MAGTLVLLKRSGKLRAGKVTLVAVIDEEMQSFGAEALILGGFRSDGAVVGEPTSNRVAIGHKGLEWLEIEFEGRAAHGGTPSAGINAISAAAHSIQLVEKELLHPSSSVAIRSSAPPVINIGTIRGGDQPSTVAAHCQVAWTVVGSTETIEQSSTISRDCFRKCGRQNPA
jgi:acetylornithine deacetylase/succinyl-diaminopimelate desuccinylase